jgi:PAS domain S-box-containing protein
VPGQKGKGGSGGGRDGQGESPRQEAETGVSPQVVIGIGASAGGLGPLQTLLSGLPPGRGLAVVIVQHQDAGSGSLLASLIADCTNMMVVEAADGLAIAADHVYVMPADRSLAVIEDSLSVREVPECHGLRMPIDHFLCTLAATQGRRAVGILLSGPGIDGTHGLAEIKALGGVTAAQDPATAEFAEMPQNALAAGHADVALPPERIAAFLLERADALAALTAQQRQQAGLEAVLAAVRHMTGHDFHCYKHGTLERRIRRRMGLRRLEDYDDYARIVRAERDEAAAMRKDLLIGVTEFFRQAEAWRVLEDKAIAELVGGAQAGATLRMWVPACASGKEAYSLAMLLVEAIERSGKKLGVQLFATDADPTAVEAARRGYYAEDDLKGISQTRLRRFFVRKSGRYEIVKELRELIVFAPQDLTSDPPFSKLGLISCRNLLIYLDSSVQKTIIQLFHFALHERGYLFLGSAETISGQEDLFEPVSQKWRIYRKLGVSTPVGLELPLRPASRPAIALPDAGARVRPTLPAIAHQALADRFGPPAAVVDRKGTLLYLCGGVEDYLQMPPGEQTGLLADAAREGLRNRLASAVLQAVSENKKVTVNARVKTGRKSVPVRVSVSPLRHPREADGLLLVTFEPQKLPKAAQAAVAAAEGEPPRSDLRQLEDELKITREELSSTIDQLEQSNEHLKASNEEVTSANEELQSANEELETSKEELQSLNEELNAVNQRLQEKVIELELAGNDVANLLTSGAVATIFLDRRLQVRRFTPAVTDLLSLIESDIGRPIADITRKFHDDALLDDARRVLVDLTPATAEAQAESGQWYLRRILPYRTKDDRIEGVVITFADVTEMKELTDALRVSEEAMREAHARAAWLARFPQENPNPILRVTGDGIVQYANPAAQAVEGWTPQTGEPAPRELLASIGQALAQGKEVRQEARAGNKALLLTVAPVVGECYANVYAIDITDRKAAEEAHRQSRDELEVRVQQRTAELAAATGYNRSLIEASLDPLVTIGPDGRITDVNTATEQATGLARGQLIGTDFSAYFTDPDMAQAGYRQVFREGSVRDYPLEIRHADGHVTAVLYNAAVYRDPRGNPVGVFAAARDITERKQAEQLAQAERQRLFDVLEALPVYVMLLTADYRVPFANRFFEERFGKSQGRRCYEYLFGRSEPCEICQTYKVLKDHRPQRWEWTGPDGRIYDIYDFPFTDSDGAPMIMEMGIDITEQRKAEAALREANETLERRVAARTAELKRSNEDLQHFAYIASHDLQEPLRMVSGFLKLLVDRYRPQLDDKAREYIDYSVEGATRMSQLIADLLAYSRVDRKGEEFRPVDAGSALAEALANLRGSIEEAGAQVTWGPLPTVSADGTQLMQLLQNLVGNAIKFRSPGRPCQVHLAAERREDRWVFSVRDNGIGVEPRHHERIFVIFQRLHNRQQYPGTGVGLAICKRIVERHGGRIWVESKVGEGSTFYFTLPRNDAK